MSIIQWFSLWNKYISLNKTYSVICKNFKKESRKLILNSSFKSFKDKFVSSQ